MEKYQYTSSFTIKYCDVDFQDEIKVSTALSLMEEVACNSAEQLGFGYRYVKEKGFAFMVSNLYLEFVKPIFLAENIILSTWPTPPKYAIFGREYQFFNEKQEVCIKATSRWCLIDWRSGKLLTAKALENQDYTTYNTDTLFESVRWKIPTFDWVLLKPDYQMVVANSAYDHNMHVNNTKYADYCLNCFSVEFLKNHYLKSFGITYVKQCKEGDRLSFYKKLQEVDDYLVEGVNQKGEVVTVCSVKFTKRK